jgi:hypothetical protein
MSKITIAEKAPTKLSDAVALALKDMAKVEKSKTMDIVMNNWHEPERAVKVVYWDTYGNVSVNVNVNVYENEKEKENCSMCMAGAVMHYKGKLGKGGKVRSLDDFSAPWKGVFEALDAFRANDMVLALKTMNIPRGEVWDMIAVLDKDSSIKWVSYSVNPEKFRAWANKVVKHLRARGL